MTRLEFQGNPISPGVGIGRAWVPIEVDVSRISRRELGDELPEAAFGRLESARARAIEELTHIQAATTRELGIQDAAIYGAQIAVLQDPAAHDQLEDHILNQRLQPESAIQALLDEFESLFEGLEGGDRKSWASDLRDPWLAVVRQLSDAEEKEERAAYDGGEGLILFAQELTPSLVHRHQRHPLAGIACARGGRFSHGAVLARSYGIPTATGFDGLLNKVVSGEPCLMDGDDGRLALGVSEDRTERARARRGERERIHSVLEKAAQESGRTNDGHRVAVQVNMESPADLKMFAPAITGGVGLFRTEFAFMEKPAFPTVEEQASIYQAVLDGFAKKPVVFRTLDIGGDKRLRYFTHPEEANPVLGWRGLRVSLEWPDLFLMQARALIEARKKGDVRILLPMVTTVEELRQAKGLIQQAAGEDEVPPIGVMIEVPAAAMSVRDLAREADFVSVGTNDLTQYMFAVDRDNPWVADLYQPYHPALLRTLGFIARSCQAVGKSVSVCGEMAGQLPGALFLAGAGFQSLSMAPPFVPEVKAVLRQAEIEELRDVASRASRCSTTQEAFSVLKVAADDLWKRVVDAST